MADADAADAKPPQVASLFATLEDALRSFSLHKAQHACDQILALAPADEDALRAKVAVCIHSESFDAALALLGAHPDLAARLPFEKAYCLYRASRHTEALDLLRDAEAVIPPELSAGALQLRAQLQYRAGAFDDCICTYEATLQVRRRAPHPSTGFCGVKGVRPLSLVPLAGGSAHLRGGACERDRRLYLGRPCARRACAAHDPRVERCRVLRGCVQRRVRYAGTRPAG